MWWWWYYHFKHAYNGKHAFVSVVLWLRMHLSNFVVLTVSHRIEILFFSFLRTSISMLTMVWLLQFSHIFHSLCDMQQMNTLMNANYFCKSCEHFELSHVKIHRQTNTRTHAKKCINKNEVNQDNFIDNNKQWCNFVIFILFWSAKKRSNNKQTNGTDINKRVQNVCKLIFGNVITT